MGSPGTHLYRISSTSFRCVQCGTAFEIYWPELDLGRPEEEAKRTVCPISGCGGEAKPVRENLVVDFRRLGERLEVIETLLRACPPLRRDADDVRLAVRVPVSLRTPMRLGVLVALAGGPMRFTELKRQLGVHDTAYIRALRILTASGLIRKGPHPYSPYEITEDGRKTLDGVNAQKQGDAHPGAF